MMRFSLLRFLIPLMAAMVACNLMASDNAEVAVPTTQPTVEFISQLPSATPVPTVPSRGPTAIPTSAGSAGGAVSVPTNCTPRSGWPTLTVAAGDNLFRIAQRVGSTVTELVSANCLSSANDIKAGQQLYVPQLPTGSTGSSGSSSSGSSGSGSSGSCTNNWFFVMRSDKADPLAPCPKAVEVMDAVGQNFEGGRVNWYDTSASTGSATIYVIYNDRSWESFPATWTPGMPESDPSIVPPENRVQPIRSIGKLWRENTAVRDKLGWAYGPADGFTGRRQYPDPVSQVTYLDIYLDHGRDGLVLRLRLSSGGGPGQRFWEVVGDY